MRQASSNDSAPLNPSTSTPGSPSEGTIPSLSAGSTTSSLRPSRRVLFRLIAVLLGLGFALGILELVVRLGIKTDEDGDETFMGGRIRPFHPRIEWTRRHADMLATGKDPCFRYDSDLGWSNNSETRCHKEQYVYDRAGLRAEDTRGRPSTRPRPEVRRIGLFGDSFTHGDDVDFEESWGEVLERELAARGVKAEVLNFGVSGYGIDQAFLRWRKHGKPFRLDAVVLGFQSENILRNHNIIRVLYYWRTQLPFTKPRFVSGPDGELRVINQPAVTPEELPAVLADLEHWDLREYDDFYVAADYEWRWWHGSRLMGFLAGWNAKYVGTLMDPDQHRYYAVDGEPVTLLLKLLETFESEVRKSGATFHVVHLPKRIDIEQLVGDPESLWYNELRDEIAERHAWVETDEAFLKTVSGSSIDALYTSSDHYSATGNQVVGYVVAEALSAARP